MDKESAHELQNLDCNCNNCIYMVRNIERFNKSLDLHKKWQLDHFNCNPENKIRGIQFQFDKSVCSINYGYCNKLNKDVSFIPNTLQIETQSCFLNRNSKINII